MVIKQNLLMFMKGHEIFKSAVEYIFLVFCSYMYTCTLQTLMHSTIKVYPNITLYYILYL